MPSVSAEAAHPPGDLMYELLPLVLAIVALGFWRRAEGRISALEDRVKVLEERPVPIDEAMTAPRSAVADAVAPAVSALPGEQAGAELPPAAAEKPSATAPEAPPAKSPSKSPAKPRESLESMIGARWPVWVGGLALALGGIFMVKYSIEQGLVSPAVRLAMSGLFGLILVGLGEGVRRRQAPIDLPALRHALVPGALTAAGVVALFGTIYAAYGVYDYLGNTLAFLLLAIVALATVGLSLLHGQALAGLGLLAAMLTPFLIESDAPSIWGLFAYLVVAWLATLAASRIRGWNAVPALANLTLMVWYVAFMATEPSGSVWAMVAAVLVMMAGLTFLWPAGDGEARPEAPTQEPAAAAEAGFRRWRSEALPRMPHRSIRFTGALAALAAAAGIMVFGGVDGISVQEMVQFSAIVVALAGAGAWRTSGAVYALTALLAAIAGAGDAATGDLFSGVGMLVEGSMPAAAIYGGSLVAPLMGLGLALAALGGLALWRHGRSAPAYAALWSWLIWLSPLSLVTISFLAFGNFSLDFKHGGSGLGYAVLFLAIALRMDKGLADQPWRQVIIGGLVTGSYLSLVLALHALTQSVVTTILVAVAGFTYLIGARLKPWPSLVWMMGLAGVVVLARIAWQPSLVGDMALSKTPFFNQLLPGYGIPALLAALGAYAVKDGPSIRARNFLQALASLLALTTVAILTRHALNGGVLAGNAPTLGEQSIYTLIAVGGSAILMTLDMKSPSPVFRWGSMVVGGISLLSALVAHVATLNPYFTGELTGEWPFFNLLLLGYLLPAFAFFGLAYYARGNRPVFYVAGLAAAGALLAFLWATLSVRRFWQGPGLAEWKGFEQGEMYAYSVVWLVLGVTLLLAGSRYKAKSLRVASAVLVFAAVIKVFLIDMSNLEGILRAASFIGLGAVLIGIGLFYQRVLRATASPEAEDLLPAAVTDDKPAGS